MVSISVWIPVSIGLFAFIGCIVLHRIKFETELGTQKGTFGGYLWREFLAPSMAASAFLVVLLLTANYILNILKSLLT